MGAAPTRKYRGLRDPAPGPRDPDPGATVRRIGSRVEPETWNLPDAALIENLSELGGVREEVLAHEELMKLLLPIVRTDLAVTARYVFPGGDPLDTPITALAGRDDPRAPPATLEGWVEQTRGRFDLHVLPGGHFFVQSTPAAVCQVTAAELARVADTGPPPPASAASP